MAHDDPSAGWHDPPEGGRADGPKWTISTRNRFKIDTLRAHHGSISERITTKLTSSTGDGIYSSFILGGGGGLDQGEAGEAKILVFTPEVGSAQ